MIDWKRARRDSRYAAFAAILAAVLFATGQIPQMLHKPRVVYWGPRPANAPSLLSGVVFRIFTTGKYHITNALHTGPTSWGPHPSVVIDQLARLVLAFAFFLACVWTKFRFPTRWIRAPLILGFLFGAASSLSDFLSFCFRGGVVDWIGVSAAKSKVPVSLLLSPTDFLLLIAAAAGVAFAVTVLWKGIEPRVSGRNPQLAPHHAE
jgi:hypothetical protein